MKYFSIILLVVLFSCKSEKHKKEVIKAPQLVFENLASPVSTSIRGISVVDSSTAWLTGANETILKTIDGGINWLQLNPPDFDSLDFRSVHAFSKSTAIVVSAGFPARVYKTANSGRTWKLVYENNDSAAFLNSIAFKNQKEGIIMGDQLKGRHVILRTGNGGETWNRIDSIDVPKPLEVENGFAASGSCIAISRTGRYFIGFGGEDSRIFSSVNGYKWKAKTTPMVHGAASSGIYSIASSGLGQIMAVGGDYTYPDSSHFPIISFNNGKSWIKTKAKVSGYRSVVDFSKACGCWLSAGTNGVDLSYNHGEKWEKIDSLNLNTLQFTPSGKHGFAANSLGKIYRIELSKD